VLSTECRVSNEPCEWSIQTLAVGSLLASLSASHLGLMQCYGAMFRDHDPVQDNRLHQSYREGSDCLVPDVAVTADSCRCDALFSVGGLTSGHATEFSRGHLPEASD
jgi:hypothetical protein